MRLKSYFYSSMEARTLGLAFLADTSAFPSDCSFLFGAVEPEGLSVREMDAFLGDLLGEGKTFNGEGLLDGLLRMAH
jgi:hypothetical protein